MKKTLCIDNVRMISRVTGDPLPGDTLLNPNNTGPDFDVYGTGFGVNVAYGWKPWWACFSEIPVEKVLS